MSRKVGMVIGVLLLIVITVIGYLKSQAFMETAAKNLSIEVTKSLNAKVNVEKLKISSLNKITAENIALYDKTGEAFAMVNHIDIAFSPLSILQGKSIVESIDKIKIDKPIVSLNRRENGEWNYQDLLSKDDSGKINFVGMIEVKDAELKIKTEEKVFLLEKLQGNFDFAVQPAISFVADFWHSSSKTEVSGTIGGKSPAISVKAKDFNVEDYLEFLPKNMPVKVEKGILKSLDITVLKESSGYKVNGEAVVLGVNLGIDQTEITDIDGLVLFNEKNLRLFSRGKIKEQPVVLLGTSTLDMVDPILDLQVSSSGFDVSKVLKDFPLLGKVEFNANIYGKYSDPIVAGNIGIKEATIYEHDIEDIKAKLYFASGRLAVENIDGKFNGGKLSGSGTFDAASQKYYFKIQAEKLPLERLENGYINEISGDLSADVIIDGQGLAFDNALVYGNATIENGLYKNILFTQINTNFYKQRDLITIDYARAVLPQGEFDVAGKIEKNQLDLTFHGADLDLSEIQKLNSSIKVTGLTDFSGKINGTISNPDIEGELTAKDGTIFSQPYQNARGSFKLNDYKLWVNDFVLKNDKETHQIKGSIGLDDKQSINLKIDSTQARAENIVKIAFDEKITGNVNNTVTLTGTLDNIKAEGNVDFYEGSFRGILLEKAVGAYKWENGNLILKDFVISSPNLNVKLTGTLQANHTLDFAINAENIDFAKLNLKLPYPVYGTGDFRGKLTGTMESPIFKGDLIADELTFNQRKINKINGQIQFKNNKIELTSVEFKQGNGIFNVSGSFGLDTEKLQGNLSVEKGSLAAILAIAGLENEWIDGDLDGSVTATGTVKNPYIQLKGIVAKGNLKGYPLTNLELDVALDKQTIKVNKFNGQQEDGLLAGKGTIDLAGPIDLEFAGSNISAGLITHLADYKADAKGKLNFGAKVDGTIDDPVAELSIDVQGGGIGSATFDSLYGLFKLENGIIQVEQLLAQKDVYKASAYGVIPLAAIKKDQQQLYDVKNQMNLRISLDQADLTILPFLTNEVDWAMGETKGSVNITGTLENPLINGEIVIKDGAIKFDSLGKPLQNLEADLCFLGNRLELKKFQGVMGKGTYQMTGSGDITGKGLNNYHFALDLDKLEIANKYYTGPLEGQLILSQDKIRDHVVPKLSGRLNVEYATIDIPVLPESEEQMPQVKLDLAVDLGKKVRLYNSFLYDIWLEGHANFTGSTRYPQTSGEINAIRGTVNYLKTSFKINEANAYFNQVNSFMPSLHLEADTRLQRTKVYLQIDGPADKMKIKLTSDPEMNESEILSLLTLRSRYYDKVNAGDNSGIGKDELMTLLDLGLQMSFLSEVENVMRNALGVDEFKVVRDTLAVNDTKDTDEVYNIEIGKYIGDKVMLHYVRGLDHESYKYGVRYDFNSKISLITDLDQDNKSSFGVEARFKF